MAIQTIEPAPARHTAPIVEPYIAPETNLREFTPRALILGTILGMIFGASSLYLVLKVGLTVSASIPVAVISLTLFRLGSKVFGIRDATILENNIAQTAGSAGEHDSGVRPGVDAGDAGGGAGRITGHPDDDPITAGPDREGAWQTEISRRHRLRGGLESRGLGGIQSGGVGVREGGMGAGQGRWLGQEPEGSYHFHRVSDRSRLQDDDGRP